MSDEKLLLIDGHSLAYRAFHALPMENFSTATGQTTNAVYGFTSMLLTAAEREAPTHIAVAFDLGRETFRLAEYSEYKAGRKKTAPEFHGQVELIKDVLGALGVPVLELKGYEADDILATMAGVGAAAGYDTYVASGDKDSFQLSRIAAEDHAAVTILYPKRGFTDLTYMTPQAVEDKYGVSPANYRGLAALVGEKADNLPGVPGVGEKTAAKWLGLYGDLPGVLAHADDIKGKAGQNLRDHMADVERNYRLNRLIDDLAPADFGLTEGLEAARLGHGERARVGELFDQLEFRQFGERIAAFLDPADRAPSAPAVELPEVRVLAADDVLQWLDGLDPAAPLGLACDADPAGQDADVLALAQDRNIGVIELHSLPEAVLRALDGVLAGAEDLACHDAKPQVKALVHRGLGQIKPHTDTELVAYLLTPDARSYDFAELTMRHLGLDLTGDAEPGTLDLDAGKSLGLRAWAVIGLASALRAELDRVAEVSLLDRIERPTQEVLARMELAGIGVDGPALSALIDEFGTQADLSAQQAYEAIGHEVNLGSPKQLQVVLFDELDMPKTKKTKTGYTTDADALTDLYISTDHPFLGHLLAYRDTIKLKQTVVGLQKTVAGDGRIHTTYLQTVAATGRLSSKDPNLQNIPVRSDAGKRIRGVFVPEADAGYTELLSADYSQIEMRIMAHLAGDESLIAAFNAGEDLHSYVAGEVFGVPAAEVTPAMRSKVKAMSYGLVYGLSAYGLSRQLRIGAGEAQGLMDDYFARFGAVKEYLEAIVEEARGRGYTETMYGRRRYLPQLNSDRRQQRQMAERAALNAPIQGSAADIMKIAMRRVDRGLHEAGLHSRLLLQVHDEVIIETHADERQEVARIVTEAMGQAATLRVPLTVNIGHGGTWEDAAH
ncbi:DNA polymerase I [Brevibacterium sp. 91QC2O2]|uniref:DNA polymerase I n=1 Tax=Brevibacterium sp. 91QC2O2 TaxID=2968458 RepID=UPI00211C33AE|nr:DNA polymerase I [Brevibacterium sp. 91QC2O2]